MTAMSTLPLSSSGQVRGKRTHCRSQHYLFRTTIGSDGCDLEGFKSTTPSITMIENTKDIVDEQASAGNTLLGPGEEVTAVDSLGVHTMKTPLMKATESARTKSPREDNRPPPNPSHTDTLTLDTYPDNTHGSRSGPVSQEVNDYHKHRRTTFL